MADHREQHSGCPNTWDAPGLAGLVKSGQLARIVWDAMAWATKNRPDAGGPPEYTDAGNSFAEVEARAAAARWRHRDGKALVETMSGSVEGMPQAAPLPPTGTGKTLDGRCGDCGTVWVVAVLPMNLSAVGKLAAKACCPACGSKTVFVSTAKTGGES